MKNFTKIISNIFLLLFLTTYNNSLFSQIFTEVISSPFEQMRSSTVQFADVDGDGDEDVLLSGRINLDVPNENILYYNDGNGNFTEVPNIEFKNLANSVLFSDLNGDDLPDILMSGFDANSNVVGAYYLNQGLGEFSEVMNSSIPGVFGGDIVAVDVDNDGDTDVMISGWNNSTANITTMYFNDGAGSFTEMEENPFVGVEGSTFAFSDIDGDGDKDVLIIGATFLGGATPNVITTNLYVNDGTGSFSIMEETPFDDVSNGSIAFSDVDNDGDEDVLVTGAMESFNDKSTKLFENDGSGNFSLMTGSDFVQTSHGSVNFADVDKDGDDDLLIIGNSGGPSVNSTLYLNDGTGIFTPSIEDEFPGYSGCSSAFSDIDGDSDLDLIITGYNGSEAGTRFYKNELFGVTVEEAKTEQLSFTSFPNPFNNSLSVRFSKDLLGEIKLIDVTGKVLLKKQITGSTILLGDLTNLPQGVYWLEVEEASGFKTTKKIVK